MKLEDVQAVTAKLAEDASMLRVHDPGHDDTAAQNMEAAVAAIQHLLARVGTMDAAIRAMLAVPVGDGVAKFKAVDQMRAAIADEPAIPAVGQAIVFNEAERLVLEFRNAVWEAQNMTETRAAEDALMNFLRMAFGVPAPKPVVACWGLPSFHAESGHKCRDAGKCIYAPPPASGD